MDAMRVGLHYEHERIDEMKRFVATIKEKGSDGVVRCLHPEYLGDVTRGFLIDFWGLNDPDVLKWKIEEFDD